MSVEPRDKRPARPLQRNVSLAMWIAFALLVGITIYLQQPRAALEPPGTLPPAVDMRTSDARTANSGTPNSGTADARNADSQEDGPAHDMALPQRHSGVLLTQMENVTIRDLDGRVEFQGTVDLAPTLERIERGDRLRFAHDGSKFANREGRLPHKPAGYYHEFVHPTPGISGPGPQRIIVGREGEIYYTHDHYQTFLRIK